MPNEAILHHPYVRVAIGAAIAVIIAALAYIAWQSGRCDVEVTEQTPAPLSDEEKLQVMRQLSASATTSLTPAQKRETMIQLGASGEATEDAKTQVMQSLHTN